MASESGDRRDTNPLLVKSAIHPGWLMVIVLLLDEETTAMFKIGLGSVVRCLVTANTDGSMLELGERLD